MPTITLVHKIHADGSPCRKCDEVLERLERDGVRDRIDRFVLADERDPHSEGMRLAASYGVERAPFFIVEDKGAEPRIYTIYMRLLREVLQQPTDERDEARDILDSDTGVDLL